MRATMLAPLKKNYTKKNSKGFINSSAIEMWLLEGSFTEELRVELSLEEDKWLSKVADYSKSGCSAF